MPINVLEHRRHRSVLIAAQRQPLLGGKIEHTARRASSQLAHRPEVMAAIGRLHQPGTRLLLRPHALQLLELLL